MQEAIDIPPSVKTMGMMKAIYDQIRDLDANLKILSATTISAVQKGIEENEIRSRLLMLSTNKNKLNKQHKAMMIKIDEKLQVPLSFLSPCNK